MTVYCTEPFIITHSLSQYDFHNVERALKHQSASSPETMSNESIILSGAFLWNILGKRKATNTEGKEGTKCAAHYVYHIEAGQEVVCKVRLYHAMEGPPHVRAFR